MSFALVKNHDKTGYIGPSFTRGATPGNIYHALTGLILIMSRDFEFSGTVVS